MTAKENKVFTVRAEKELIEAFTQTCKAQDTTASREVRQFMRDYLRQNAKPGSISKSDEGAEK